MGKTINNWKDVLNTIYEKSPDTYGWGKLLNHCEHPLCKERKVDCSTLEKSIAFLTDHELIDQNTTTWRLTPKGFSVAMDNEKNVRMLLVSRVAIGVSIVALLLQLV